MPSHLLLDYSHRLLFGSYFVKNQVYCIICLLVTLIDSSSYVL